MAENCKQNGNRLVTGVIWKEVLIFFVPLLLGAFLQQLYNTADAMIVGRFVGPAALSAVGGTTGQILNLIIGFFLGLSSGAMVIISQFFGGGRRDEVNRTIHASLALSLAGGAALTVLGIVAAPTLLRLLNTPEEVMGFAVPYLRIYFAGTVANLLYNMGSGILRAVGDSKSPLWVLLACTVVNVLLDLLFVGVFQMATAGAAIATVLSQLFSAVLVLLLAILTAAFHFLIASQPEAENALSARKPGSSTILVAGTDEGGYRTDSMMLVNVDRTEKTISLVSIPRDTLIYCEYSVPKINSAYGWAGGGEQGMQELLLRVSEIIGFTPDGYVVVDLSIFQQLVDLMGGVTFDVPVDMHYSDPTQNLNIDLQAGKQRLNGEQAMQVARFRSGYATADLGRIEVQRSLASAAIRQWVSLRGAIHLPQAVKLIADHTNTDLSTRNLLWLAESFLLCSRSDIKSATLPGYAENHASGSYYVLDAAGVADIVNQYINPYEKGVQAADLFIRNA